MFRSNLVTLLRVTPHGPWSRFDIGSWRNALEGGWAPCTNRSRVSTMTLGRGGRTRPATTSYMSPKRILHTMSKSHPPLSSLKSHRCICYLVMALQQVSSDKIHRRFGRNVSMTAMVVHPVDRMETEKHPRLQARNVPEAMKHAVAAAAWDKMVLSTTCTGRAVPKATKSSK